MCLALYVWERKGGGLTMLNRKAVFVKCDVLSWEDQLSMFETAISKYGSVDIVVRASFHSRFCSFHAGKPDIYFSNRYLTRELRKFHISIRSPSMQVVNRWFQNCQHWILTSPGFSTVSLSHKFIQISGLHRVLINNKLLIHLLAIHLSLHYLKVNKKAGDLKSLILIGSMGMKAFFLLLTLSVFVEDHKIQRLGCLFPGQLSMQLRSMQSWE